MTRDDRPFICWKCGADLKAVPRPFSRFAECPGCKTELHVCRMCVHYAPRYIGQCSHEHADKVAEKEKSNFCGHFKPGRDLFAEGGGGDKAHARQELDSLFGGEDDAKQEEPATDTARRRLDDLFNDGS